MLIPMYPTVAGQWLNAVAAEWYGIGGAPGDYTFRACWGDPDSTNETNVLTFGPSFSVLADAEDALDELVDGINAAALAQRAPFFRFDTERITAGDPFPVRWLSTASVFDIVVAGVQVLVNSGKFPQYLGDQAYADNAAAKAAADALASSINGLY